MDSTPTDLVQVALDVFNPYSVVLAGICVTAALQGRQTWLLADFVGSLLFGVSLILTPHLLLSLQTSVRLDPVSLHMTRCIGCMMLASSFFAYFAYVSPDPAVKESHIQSRVIGNCLLLLAMTYAHIHYKEFTIEHIQFGFAGCVSWTLPSLYYLFRIPLMQKTSTAAYDFFILVDFAVTLLFGTVWFAFPQWILRDLITIKPNGVSVHMSRAFGSLLIGSSFLSFSATHLTPDVKKIVMLSRIVGAMPLLAEVITVQLKGPYSVLHVFFGVTGAGLWIANALLGYLILTYVESMGVYQQEFSLPANLTADGKFHSS